MSEVLSSLIQQTFQQGLENQPLKQQQTQTKNKNSFESHLRQKDPSQKTTKTSGAELDGKLQQMQAELAQKIQSNKAEKMKPNEIPKELLDNKTRFGLMKEAYSKVGDTSSMRGFEGRMIQTESEFKEIESLMKSDKNLSPGELLALQARLYQVSQHIEVMSKVVDQMAGGIKTVLNTNI